MKPILVRLYEYRQVTTMVLLYWVVSTTTIFVNKILLSGSRTFYAPFFIAWFQCVFSVVACYLIYLLVHLTPGGKVNFPKVKWEKCIRISPLSVIFVAMMGCNNMFLAGVPVSFYSLGRSLSTVFSALLSYVILGQRTSFTVMVCCGVVIFGFIIGVKQEEANTEAFTLGILAALFATLDAVCTTKMLPAVEDNIGMLTIYNNINASFLLLLLIIGNLEPNSIMASEIVRTWVFWFEMFIASTFGLATGYAVAWEISKTSPLTHNISATARLAFQTLLATYVYSEEKSFWWWASNFMVLSGSMAYTWVKTWVGKVKKQNTVV